ncbi:hypothetical protein E5288_WYG022684 [Bos mutus]|uniref:Uncharacterized protein n=1 Tax=Bos mutus TaxID=72004 RepID=A0A6B0R1P0_9CETA|nr:hypothetical protein [Bos mutus]
MNQERASSQSAIAAAQGPDLTPKNSCIHSWSLPDLQQNLAYTGLAGESDGESPEDPSSLPLVGGAHGEARTDLRMAQGPGVPVASRGQLESVSDESKRK